jgi:hypothetical protein
MLEGLATIVPGATPVPETGTAVFVSVRCPELDTETTIVTTIVVLTIPAEVGVKLKLNVALWFGVRMMGKVGPVAANALLLAATCWTESLPVLEFVKVTGRVWLLPTCTLPKLTLAGLTVRLPVRVPVPARLVEVRVPDTAGAKPRVGRLVATTLFVWSICCFASSG